MKEAYKELKSTFIFLEKRFLFQPDSVANQREFLVSLLESRQRSCQLSFQDALVAVHKDLLANYEKWRLLVIDVFPRNEQSSNPRNLLQESALYLCIWGEASNLRFCPETLCFLFQVASDALDHDEAPSETNETASFLDVAIDPLYHFLKGQWYKERKGKTVRRSGDHAATIGYDDCNELFWSAQRLKALRLEDGTKFFSVEAHLRFEKLGLICWKKALRKTFYERRTPIHVFVNFVSIWILHISVFFLYLSLVVQVSTRRDFQVTFVGCGGALSVLVTMLSLVGEMFFVPGHCLELSFALIRGSLLFILNAVIPVVQALLFVKKESSLSIWLAYLQLVLSVVTTLLCVFYPRLRRLKRHTFTADFAQLSAKDALFSRLFWVAVFSFKLAASYFYLVKPIGLPLEALLSSIKNDCRGDLFCIGYGSSVIVTMVSLNMVLFMLDSYIWYIICNTILGIGYAFLSGVSVFSPWRLIFGRLSERMISKLTCRSNTEQQNDADATCSSLWNAVVDSWYRDYIISKREVEVLKYKQVGDGLEAPAFFVRSEDRSNFLLSPEANRRSAFFAQSLATPMPLPTKVSQTPLFTVLVPHFSEKILLPLRDLIFNYEDHASAITLLDYLKALFPQEWENFIETFIDSEHRELEDAKYIALRAVGFFDANPADRLRTRIWASLRSQTLFRTINGFHNYHRAFQLLKRLEDDENDGVPSRILLAMQRYAQFSAEEYEDTELLLDMFSLEIAFIDSVDGVYYSCLIDKHCLKDGLRRVPKFRIRLPGDPILGDGKSDNQNHALIFTRGEILQLIDANQDNYFEEALKVRNALADMKSDDGTPVAILGAREHIFSEGIGVLGDIAAGKEYTFGTISQRVSSILNSRLHYGHPDFLNTAFMISRGGISKGQKGLHLNEDIYAGMTALVRGGKIKHTEYFQCGKGRDLGFSSILGFVAKIGSGMGEQMLSREQYQLGLNLPFDRLCSFYFAHAGFHLNNIFSMLSIKMFAFAMIQIFCFSRAFKECDDSIAGSPVLSSGCFRIDIMVAWLAKSVGAVVVVLLISYLPFMSQITSEFGLWYALRRFFSQILSLAPLFEVFTTQIYAYNLASIGWSLGGSGYISTGRGFSTYRHKFVTLYSTFARPSLYLGIALLVQLFATIVSPLGSIFPFFGFVAVALLLSPFMFNVSQFAYQDFVLDYGDFLDWFARGNSDRSAKSYSDSWISHHHRWRSCLTGVDSGSDMKNGSRSHFVALLFQEVLPVLTSTFAIVASYLFFVLHVDRKSSLLQSLVQVCLFPVVLFVASMLAVAVMFLVSFVVGNLCSFSNRALEVVSMSAVRIVRGMVIIVCVALLLETYMAERWSWSRTMLSLCCSMSILNLVITVAYVMLLSRDSHPEVSNYAWWSGKWYGRDFGFRFFTAVPREFLCKVLEQIHFCLDFLLGNLLWLAMFPLVLIPRLSQLHDRMLMWSLSDDDRQVFLQKAHVRTTSEKKIARRKLVFYTMALSVELLLLVGVLIVPLVMKLPSVSLSTFIRF